MTLALIIPVWLAVSATLAVAFGKAVRLRDQRG